MVGLNPAKFYGRFLPRPRIYCDVKFSESRVDTPEPVNAAFLEWASEASWKMGGTALKRKRMRGKIEGRVSILRNMEESDEIIVPPPSKKVRAKLSFGKKKRERKELAALVPDKHRTPIERMLESPGNAIVSKRGKLAPRRIISDDDTENQAPVVAISRPRRIQKEPLMPDSEGDSDNELEEFLQKLQADKLTPTRNIRKSTRLHASPTPSLTPNSKRPLNARGSGDGRRISRHSPLTVKRTRVNVVSGSDSGSESSRGESESIFL